MLETRNRIVYANETHTYDNCTSQKIGWLQLLMTAENRTMAAFWLLGLINNSGNWISCTSSVLDTHLKPDKIQTD